MHSALPVYGYSSTSVRARTADVQPCVQQVIGPLLAGLESTSRRFINNLVWDFILVCIDAPGDSLQSTIEFEFQTAFLTEIWACEIRTSTQHCRCDPFWPVYFLVL